MVLLTGIAPIRHTNQVWMLRLHHRSIKWWAEYFVIIADAARKLVAHSGAAPLFVD